MTGLGRLAIKTAQQGPPGLLGQIVASSDRATRGGASPSIRPDGNAARAGQSTVVTGAGALTGGAMDLFGELGAVIGPLLPMIAPHLKEWGIDLMKPYQVGYGGDPRDIHEQQRVNQFLVNKQMQSNGEHVQRMIKGLGNYVETLPPTVKSLLSKVGVGPEVIQGFLQSPGAGQIIGQVYAQLSPIFPQIARVGQALDPSLIVDGSMFARHSAAMNNGQIDLQQADQLMEGFKNLYRNGGFGDVPAQTAAHAYGYVQQQMGGRANPSQMLAYSRNLAQAADAAYKAGLAPTFGEAMNFVSSVAPISEVVKGDSTAVESITQLGDMARRYSMQPQEIAAAAQVAREKGLDPMTAMSIVAQSGHMNQAYGEAAASKLRGGTIEAYARLQQTPWADALGAAIKVDPRYRKRFEQYSERGDVKRLQQLGQYALRDRKLMADVGGPQAIQGAGSNLMGELSAQNPQLLQGLMASQLDEATRKYMPRGLGSKFQRLVKRDPEALAHAFETNDFSQIGDRRLGAYLSQNPAIAGSAMSLSPEITGRRTFKPLRRIKRPTRAPAAPLSRIGLAMPTAESAAAEAAKATE